MQAFREPLRTRTHPRRQQQQFPAGQALFEVILALAIFGTLVASLSSFAVGGFRALEQGGEQTEAEYLAQEGLEAVRSIRDGSWNELRFAQSSVTKSGSEWVFSGEGTTEVIGQYTRTIDFADICRDANDDIASCPALYTDIHAQRVTVDVTWNTGGGQQNSVQRISYLTNWESRLWREDTTVDFGDGLFSGTESSPTLGDGDGAIILQSQ